MLALIGGTGADRVARLDVSDRLEVTTPYGAPSEPVVRGSLSGAPVLFLPRHGANHQIPPHAINYRANLWALRECGASGVIALNAVGAINAKLGPADLAVPDQVIDYTWGRAHTYFDGESGVVEHVDFTVPYDAVLREAITMSSEARGIRCFTPCCYAATQGPRLESAAEIDRMERDGADLVGMTGMPEAALARELTLPYASLCIVANMAAGRGEGVITMEEVARNLSTGVKTAFDVLEGALK